MSKHKTAKGKEFNMQVFAANNGDKVAIGNSNRNARGDLLGPGGKIISTAQAITNKVYNQTSKTTVPNVSKVDPNTQETNRKQVLGADGVSRIEITYADGSVEIVADDAAPKKATNNKIDQYEDLVDIDMTFDRKEL